VDEDYDTEFGWGPGFDERADNARDLDLGFFRGAIYGGAITTIMWAVVALVGYWLFKGGF
jgi:hypothetical protein